MVNSLLIFPPQWMPISPYFAMLTLVGQFRAQGLNVGALDLNIDFYSSVLKQRFLENSLSALLDEEAQKERLRDITTFYKQGEDFSKYSLKKQVKLVKYAKIKEFLKNISRYKDIPTVVEDAVATLRDERFFEPPKLLKAMSVIDLALDIASAPYAPSKLSFDAYTNPLFKLDWENIKHFVFCKETNIFRPYFESKLDEILAKKPDYIGISINSSSQIVPALTLCNLLKEKTTAHINIGGNFFGRVIETISQKKDFFELFAHSVLVEEGEKPCIELSRAVGGEIPFCDVPNLVYFENGEVKTNPKAQPKTLNELANIDFEDFKDCRYLSPKVVLPHQTSKGCYWGKCSFCDQDFGQNFNVKNVSKMVDELSFIQKTWGISDFEFIDESVSPAYLEEFSRTLLERGVKINYFSNARLERAFTPEILKQASRSGLKMLLWGLESGSERIMELINKGIDVEKRLEILKDSKDAGIWNFAFIFFGFPAETREDALLTVKMLEENTSVISSYGRSVFTMGKHTKLRDNPLKYGLLKLNELEEELSPSYSFEGSGMDKKELLEVTKLCTERSNAAYGNPLWMYLRYREFLFLYIAKYGVKWVEDYDMGQV